jgi:hypothetical protein
MFFLNFGDISAFSYQILLLRKKRLWIDVEYLLVFKMWWLYNDAGNVNSLHEDMGDSLVERFIDFYGIFDHWNPGNDNILAYFWLRIYFLKVFDHF